MRPIFVIALLAVIAVPALAATPQQSAMKSCSAKWSAMTAADKGKTKRPEFMSGCMKADAPAMAMKPVATGSMAMTAKPAGGNMAMTAAKPGSMAKPASGGGEAKCKDGTTVTYKNRPGTCTGHGGVATWL